MTARQRLWIVLAVVASAFLIALPALAQEAPPEEGPSAGNILLAVGVFGGITKYAIQLIKRHAPNLSGSVTQLIAIVVGIGLAALLDFRAAGSLLDQANVGDVIGREIGAALDWIISGVAIAMASGIIAEVVGTSGPKAEAARAETRANEAIANGSAGTINGGAVPLHGNGSHIG